MLEPIPMQLKSRNRIGTINVFIIADDVLPVPLLLGRYFLSGFGIRLMQVDEIERSNTGMTEVTKISTFRRTMKFSM